MAYDINSQGLVGYAYARLWEAIFKDPGQKSIDIEETKGGIVLFRLRGEGKRVADQRFAQQDLKTLRAESVLISPSFIPRLKSGDKDKIEIAIEPYKAGVTGGDVCRFLELLVNDDQIFSRGNPLFNIEKLKDLKSWKEVLRRSYERGQNKMSCYVIDPNASTGRLKRAFYEYMVRPCRYYLFNLGRFQSDSE